MATLPLRILLIDDDATDRANVAQIVRSLPFPATFFEASDDETAVAMVARERPDVVLLDFQLPGATGPQIIQRLRASGSTVPIVLMTATSDPEAVASMMRAGAIDYLPKRALDVVRLEHVVRGAIRIAEAERSAQAATAALERHAVQLTWLLEASLRVQATTRLEDAVSITAEAAAAMLDSHASVELTRGRERHHATHGEPVTVMAEELEVELLSNDSRARATLRLRRAEAFERAEQLLARQLARATGMAIEKQLLIEAARENAKARQEIVSIVSHDLRTPLQSFSLGLDVLNRHTAGNASAASVLARLRRGVDSMNRLLTNLLDVTRIRDATLSLNLSKHTPKALLDELAEQTAPLAHQKGIELKVGTTCDVRFVCDGTRIAQAISNFISNAIKHTEKGRIELRATQQGDLVCFEVADTGPGIKPEVREHLFDRLYQAPGGARGGIGLGLYIAKGIAEAHGGHVVVDSELGNGSTFSLCIPIVDRAPQLASQ